MDSDPEENDQPAGQPDGEDPHPMPDSTDPSNKAVPDATKVTTAASPDKKKKKSKKLPVLSRKLTAGVHFPATLLPSQRVYRGLNNTLDNPPSSTTLPDNAGEGELNLLRNICPEDSDLLQLVLKSTTPGWLYRPVAPEFDEADEDSEDEVIKAKNLGLDTTQPPLNDIHRIFEAIVKQAIKHDFLDACKPFVSNGLKVITMCSGSEAPFVAMDMVRKALITLGKEGIFQYDHAGSAEIEPWKQAFIERNFSPPQIFRDVTDFEPYSKDPNNKALWPMTAYGAREKPQDRVHLLIAGSSCVDYSVLNTKMIKEGLGKGESANTALGILSYAKLHKPTIIILENVEGAPWDDVKAKWAEIGYQCVAVRVDTINFYLPQTRSRGYLFGINLEQARAAGLDVPTALSRWESEFGHFQQRASSPYSDFALADSDSRLLLAKDRSNDASGNKPKGQSWANCRIRHVRVRAERKLGNATPYTNRRGNSKAQLPDFAWQSWADRQTKRVLDCIDIHHLICAAERDYDTTYKHRNINVSQNVDRDIDSRPWGVTGAITPHGTLFDTKRGRPLTGLEVFALQGFPIGDLNLGSTTSRQLQNLAGNAMSTTVIGTAILSAIIACHDPNSGTNILEHYADQTPAMIDSPLIPDRPEDTALLLQDMPHIHDFAQRQNVGLDETINQAVAFRPLCHCEGLDRRSIHKLLYCKDCEYICCQGCSRDSHGDKLVEMKSTLQREPNAIARNFVSYMTEVLPPVLNLAYTDSLNIGDFYPNLEPEIREEILDLMSMATNGCLRFQEIKFEGFWKVVYVSDTGRLELDLFPKRYPCYGCKEHEQLKTTCYHDGVTPMWLFFVTVPNSTPAGSHARQILQHHVARMQPRKTLFDGIWELWNGPGDPIKLRVTGQGDKVPAWESKLGIQARPFCNMNVFSELLITKSHHHGSAKSISLEKITGKYRRQSYCPSPCGTLHRKDAPSSSSTSPIFLHLKPNPLGQGYEDQLVFSSQALSQGGFDDRNVIARLEPSFRPVASGELSQGIDVACTPFDEWSSFATLKLEPHQHLNTIRIWHNNLQINTALGEDCSHHLTFLRIELRDDACARKRLEQNRDLNMQLAQKPAALVDFGWVTGFVTKGPYLKQGWKLIKHSVTHDCVNCAPQSPEVAWMETSSGKQKKIKALEHPLEAARYERALKSRPQPALARLRNFENQVVLDIDINLPTLVHRVKSQFTHYGLAPSTPETLSWRLTYHNPYTPAPCFGVVQLRSNEYDEMPGFDFVPEAQLKRSLWKSQMRALSWMIQQEVVPPAWDEIALVESCLPALERSIECGASKQNKQVYGGIIADEVGAGKTTTSLALVSRDFYLQQPKVPADATPANKLDSQATLILVPKNLLSQWEKELIDCLGWKKLQPGKGEPRTQPYYIMFSDLGQLQKFSRQEIQDATIILAPWQLFNPTGSYWETLADVAGSPADAPNTGRAFQSWLKDIIAKLDECTKKGLEATASSDHTAFDDAFRTQWETNEGTCTDFRRFEGYMTRDIRKQMYMEAKKAEEKSTDPKNKDADDLTPEASCEKVKKDTDKKPKVVKKVKKVKKIRQIPNLLHMFKFRRMIVDEFTYISGETLLALIQLAATRRWLLSGTPPIHRYDDVNTMAKLLQTRVASYDEQEGNFSFGSDGAKWAKAKSAAQEFLALNRLNSSDYMEQMYAHARKFLSIFARKNTPSLPRKEKVARTVKFNLTLTERVLYTDALPLAMDPDRIFGKKHPNNNAGKQADELSSVGKLINLTELAETPEAALIGCELKINQVWDLSADDLALDLSFLNDRAEYELARMSIIIKEQNDFLYSLTSQIFEQLRELWGYEDLARKVGFREAAISFDKLVKDIHKGEVSDGAALATMKLLLWGAKCLPLKPTNAAAMTFKKLETAYLERVAQVEGHIDLLGGNFQRQRYLGVAESIASNQVAAPACSSCGMPMGATRSPHLSRCGHLVCGPCVVAEEACCPAFDDAIGTEKFRHRFLRGAPTNTTSSRLRSAVAVVRAATARKEKVLVFAQDEGMKDAFCAVCNGVGILVKNGWRGAVGAVKEFQTAAEGVVLVLKVDSPDAAGWNLQAANNVVFLAPVWARTAAEQEATMEQAVGRCWRPGQLRAVFVHLLAADGTIESRLADEWMAKERAEAEEE